MNLEKKAESEDEDDMPTTISRGRRVIIESSESEDEDHPAAMPDYEDGVDKCPRCGWEIEDGQCTDLVRCGKMVKESGDVSRGSFLKNESWLTVFIDRRRVCPLRWLGRHRVW